MSAKAASLNIMVAVTAEDVCDGGRKGSRLLSMNPFGLIQFFCETTKKVDRQRLIVFMADNNVVIVSGAVMRDDIKSTWMESHVGVI